MMKFTVVLCAVFSIFLSSSPSRACDCGGQGKKAAAPVAESVHGDVQGHRNCFHCGMDRERFYRSRMLVTYVDGTVVGTCSLHCMATELKDSQGKNIKSVEVADYNTGLLIAAEKAFWVIGGDQRGVMTSTPKWAFAEKTAATAFMAKHGGKGATYGEALTSAEQE
ncbi:MAG: nitrous oxide reductase accessory protein NosL [Desulfuromonadales bacterium]|nr:nitrous oxide reductase accessory protein NosL [Desulfuromonadales bacterium]